MTKYHLKEFSSWLQLNCRDYYDNFKKGYEYSTNFSDWVEEISPSWENLGSLEWLTRVESQVVGYVSPDATKWEKEAIYSATAYRVLEAIERYKRDKQLNLVKKKLISWTKLLKK